MVGVNPSPMSIRSFDVIIIGGSYSGLSAAMALGRSLRTVLVIDSGKPCNRQTPYSHNFLTNDGRTPKEIAAVAQEQVRKYKTVEFFEGLASSGFKTSTGFEITTSSGETFGASKLIFATGIRDILPNIEGLAECWGITVVHCPYCHGYEIKSEKTGFLSNGDIAFEFSTLLSNWTKDLTVFTNGKSTMTTEQAAILQKHNINIVEKEIARLDHQNSQIEKIIFKDNTTFSLKALYTRAPFDQHCTIPQSLGCELNEQGYLKVDGSQKTTIPGVFACGDAASGMRTVSNAVGTGTTAAAHANREIIFERF